MLAESDIEKFSRQLILRGWSAELQERLAKLAIHGLEDYPTARLYLQVAGVGTGAITSVLAVRLTERANQVEIEATGRARTLLIPAIISESIREPFVGSLIAAEILMAMKDDGPAKNPMCGS